MTSAWSRRGFLAATGGSALSAGLAGPAAALAPRGRADAVDAFAALRATRGLAGPAAALAPRGRADAVDAFAALRATWRTLILGEGFSPTAEPFRTKLATLGTQAASFRSAMAPASGALWPDLVYADPEPDTDQDSYGCSQRMNDSFNRLATMAQAYCRPGTGLTGDTGLKDAVIAGLDHLCSEVYSAAEPRFGNWWNFQIGSPQALLDTAVLLHEHLTPQQKATYCAAVDAHVPDSAVASYTGTSTGANRVDLCRVLVLRGIVGDSAAKVVVGRDALSPVFPYVTAPLARSAASPSPGGTGSPPCSPRRRR